MSADTALPIVDIRGVSKVYRLQDQTIHALSGANLSIRKGEFVCLIGASGCGKSTLLRIMAGFEPPSSGEALMWGKPISGPDPSRGMVFQDYALFPWLSVRDNIGFGPAARGLSSGEVKATVDKFVDLVGLQKFANAYPHQLSGGQKARVGIARAIALKPDLVILDMQIANMGGIAVAIELRLEEAAGRLDPSTIVLLLDREADQFVAQRADADATLVKPVDAGTLRRTAKRLLAAPASVDQN